MHLSGELSDWSISDLLQIMQVTNKTGSLDIEGQRRGRVHFREGRVTGAELIGSKGSYSGTDRASIADILYVLSTVGEGSFSVGPADGPEVSGWTVEDVLSDVEALQSLEGEVVDTGLFEAGGVVLVSEIDEPVAIHPEDWHVFVQLVPPFSFGFLENHYGRGSAVRIFHTLHRLGLAQVTERQDGDEDWLERLAADVAPTSPALADEPVVEELAPGPLDPELEDEAAVSSHRDHELRGVAAPASTTLTDGVYDEIRRLRSRVGDK